MKVVVIGGRGLIGAKLVQALRRSGHEAVAASRASGIDTVTGAGLGPALAGAEVLVDVADAPSFEPAAAMAYVKASGERLLEAGAAAGIAHHVALSIVNVDRLPESGYFRAKMLQERMIEAGAARYTILRSTQSFEFLCGFVQMGGKDEVALPPARVQPIAADDLAALLAEVAAGAPANRRIEVGGPEKLRMDDLARAVFTAYEDPRRVTVDPHARFLGAELDDRSLIPRSQPHIASTHFTDWLSRSLQ